MKIKNIWVFLAPKLNKIVLLFFWTGINCLTPSVATVAQEIQSDNGKPQVNSVFQLRDVSPGDWAFEALRNLVERYGCIAGYPNGSYRGNRVLTRYEFAAGLNACLQQIERLIQTGSTQIDSGELATIERLRSEFATELSELQNRVDVLEGRIGELEENQFSTTTKLFGNVFFNLTGAFADGTVRAEGVNAFAGVRGNPVRQIDEDPNITFSNVVWLTLNSSFSGKDSLLVKLAAGNGSSPVNQLVSGGLNNTFGTPLLDRTSGPNRNDVVLAELSYSFPVGSSFQVVIGPRVNWYRYFDHNRFTFFFNGANSYNSTSSTLLNSLDQGAGAVVLWDINDKFNVRVAYLGENNQFLPSPPFNSSSDPNRGLFNGTNSLTTELTVSPINNLNLRFIYNYTNLETFGGLTNGALGEPIRGIADDGAGGPLDDAEAHVFVFNFDWLISSKFGLFGRYSYGNANLNPATPGVEDPEINAQSLQLGVAFPDLLKEGALATVSYLTPFSVLDGNDFLVSGGGDGGVMYQIEATYFYPINRNIAIVPAFYFIGNPNNFSDNPNIYVGNLRMQFSF